MLKRFLFVLGLLLFVVGYATANIIPHPELNIPYLCTFGLDCPKDWGDDDYTNIIFLQVPTTTTDSLYLRVFDPDVGNNIDEVNVQWKSETEFAVYGGPGAYTNEDARQVDPTGDYRSGTLLFSSRFGQDPQYDSRWTTIGAFAPDQGEQVDGWYVFKVIIQGVVGDDGNLYKLALSTDRTNNIFPADMASYAFEWSFRLPNSVGEVVYICPFEIPDDVATISKHMWDFDNDNKMFLQTPLRTLPAYTGGNNEWTDTRYFLANQDVEVESSGKHWEETTYEITPDEREGLWCFTVIKGTYNNNDVVFYVNSDTGDPLKLTSAEPPSTPLQENVVEDLVIGDCNTVVVDASRSTDPNQDILTFEWDFGDGTKTEGVRVVHRYDNPGVYTISLTAYDHSGVPCDVGFKAIEVVINDPPVADAGPDQYTSVGHEVAFDGTGSYDNDGKIIEYLWDFGDGTTKTGYAPTHSYQAPGTYHVTLTVTDDSGSKCDKDRDEMVIVVNDPPKALLGPDLLICDLTVAFDATGSSDADGLIDRYVWDFGDGTKGAGPQVTHTYQSPGKYVVTLTVHDNSGMVDAYDSATMNVVINGRPVADAGAIKTRAVCVDENVTFDGSNSYDPEGYPLKYEWDFGDGSPTDNRIRVEHSYSKPGEYLAILKVTDESMTVCNTDYDSVRVQVFIAPDAQANTLGPRQVCVGDTVKFDGSSSSWYIPISYYWYFGDNTEPAEGEFVSHVFQKPGIYDVELTVMDNSGSSCNRSQDIITIEVNYPPTAQAGVDKRAAAGDVITFTDAGSRDQDGRVVGWSWDFGDGGSAEGEEVTHSYNAPGKYPVVLTVQDDSGLPCSTDMDTIFARINYPPVADAGPDELICVGKVQFSGTNSSDQDGQIIEYIWDFGDGNTGRGENPYHIYAKTGTYNVTLTVRDNSGTATDTASDTKVVRINTPPKAVAGMGGTIRPGESFRFDGSQSFDADGDEIISYEWDFGDGTTGSGQVVDHQYNEPGSYLVTLTVMDDTNVECNTGVDNTYLVVNAPPVAKAGVQDGDVFCTADQIVFDGSGSFDPDGKELAYEWDFGDGATGTGVKATHKYTTPGRYDVTLTVTDDAEGAELSDTDIIVVTINTPPVADAGPDIMTCSTTISFDGTNSSDPDGTISVYAWDFGDGSGTDNGATPTYTFTEPGTYTVTLTVTDDSGTCSSNDSDALIVTINQPPIAKAGGDKKGCPGETISFDGGRSFDPDGNITAYSWDFGDGSSATGATVSHEFEEPSKYTVVLTVTDDSESTCNQNTDAITVFINTPPIADAGPDQKVCVKSANCEVFFDGSASRDPDGGALTFEWDFGDGGTGSGMRPAHTYQEPGTYTVTLTVTDDSGTNCGTASDTLVIEANEQPVPVIDLETP